MSMKKIIEIASNEDAMSYLEEIARIQSNMCFKTQYEQKSAKMEIKRLAQAVIDSLN